MFPNVSDIAQSMYLRFRPDPGKIPFVQVQENPARMSKCEHRHAFPFDNLR